MRQRWRICLAAVGLAVVLGLGGVLRSHVRRPRINEASYARLEKGMTRQQVEALLGAAPGSYLSGRAVSLSEPPVPGEPPPTDWWSDEGRITITFDEQGTVKRKLYRNVYAWPQETAWQRLLHRLGF